MPRVHAAAGKNIKNAAGNSCPSAINFQAVPFTSNKPSAYYYFTPTADEVVPESPGFKNKTLSYQDFTSKQGDNPGVSVGNVQ